MSYKAQSIGNSTWYETCVNKNHVMRIIVQPGPLLSRSLSCIYLLLAISILNWFTRSLPINKDHLLYAQENVKSRCFVFVAHDDSDVLSTYDTWMSPR